MNDEKVIKKINKIMRWIGHSGGMNEIWFTALSVIVFRMHEEAGFQVTVTPQGQLTDSENNNDRNTPSRIIITDF